MHKPFLRSLIGSFNALITNADADGITDIVAWRFAISIRITTPIPFQSIVAFAISSPNFLGDIPNGPILGAKTAGGAGSPPLYKRLTSTTYNKQNTKIIYFILAQKTKYNKKRTKLTWLSLYCEYHGFNTKNSLNEKLKCEFLW